MEFDRQDGVASRKGLASLAYSLALVTGGTYSEVVEIKQELEKIDPGTLENPTGLSHHDLHSK